MSLQVSDFGVGEAKIVHPGAGQDLMSLSSDEVRALMFSSGAIVFRGFGADALMMRAFAGRFSVRFNRDRLRVPVEETQGQVQLVTEGMGCIEPHAEQANSPFRPDAIWFCCGAPAESAGETLFWDGIEVWRRLTPAVRRLFESKRLRYFQKYRPDQWRLFVGEDATIDTIQRMLASLDGVSAFIDADQSIYLEYLCYATSKTKHGGQLAFANCLLTESKNTLGRLMTFEDGTPVPGEAIAEIEEVMAGITGVVDWQVGTLMFLDNTRYMHGRNAFTDKRRKIYSCMSFLDF